MPEKGTKLPVEILSRDEVERLIAACSRRGHTGIRNRALIAVLWRCGLRISEALALKPSDVDVEAGTITVLSGKGQKRRTVGMDSIASTHVMHWMDRRKSLDINGHNPLFCTLKGKPMYSSYVRQLLPRLAEKAGIDKRVHPHGLRHTLAVELVREGVNPVHIQRTLGHSDLSTTTTYLAGLQPQETIDILKSRE